jgi:hypothetical protein
MWLVPLTNNNLFGFLPTIHEHDVDNSANNNNNNNNNNNISNIINVNDNNDISFKKNSKSLLSSRNNSKSYNQNINYINSNYYNNNNNNSIFVLFDEPVTISFVKFWNYSKTPTRGVKDLEVFIIINIFINIIIINIIFIIIYLFYYL